MYRSIPGLHLLDAGSTLPLPHCDHHKCLQVLTDVPWEMKSPLCPTRANQRTPGPLEGSSGGWELWTTKLIRSSEEPLEPSQDNT